MVFIKKPRFWLIRVFCFTIILSGTGFTQNPVPKKFRPDSLSVAAASTSPRGLFYHDGKRSVPRHGIYEFALRAANASRNLYLNGKALTVTFTGTSGAAQGKSVTVQGFWDGGQTYRARFSPPLEGTWQWQTASADAGLNGKSGGFTCAGKLPAGHVSARGHVRESQTYPYTFAHADGTPFFLCGDTQWSFSTSAISWPEEFQTYVKARAAQGFNYIHGVLYQTWPPGNAANEGGLPFFTHHPDSLNAGFWRAFDQRVAYLNENGLVAGLMLAWASDAWQYFSTRTQIERYAQYLINRYAAYNVFWIVAGEYEEYEPPGGHAAIGNYLRRNDPYQHPRTIHTIHTSAEDYGNDAWQTTIYQQIFHGRQITPDRRFNKPVINSEFGYEGDQTPEEARQDAWEIVMRGGFFVYGDTNTFHASAVMSPANLYSPGAAFISILKNFWTNNAKHDFKWWQFDRFEEVGPRRFLAGRRGAEYLVYADTLGAFTVDLSDLNGNVFGRWFDTKTGKWGATFGAVAEAAFRINPPATGSVAYLAPRADLSPPVISALQAKTLSANAAVITWQTDEPAFAQVEYGLTQAFGSRSNQEVILRTQHEIVLHDLQPNRTYHYRALATDTTGNAATSTSFTFTTSPAPEETLRVARVILFDSLRTRALGKRTGGRFVREGGWQVTDPDNMIVYDLGRYLKNGVLEVEVRNFHPQTQNFFARHHLMSMFRNPWGNHHPIENTETVWDLHAGYYYAPGMKMLSWAFDQRGESSNTGTNWDPARTYRFKVAWAGRQLRFFIDDSLQLTHTHSSEMELRYLFLGRDRTISGDLVTNYRHNQYPALGGPIFSNVRVREIFAAALPLPLRLAAVATENLYANAARLSWKTSAPALCYVEYGTTENYGERTPVLGAYAETFSTSLANLSANETYHYRIVASDAGGRKIFSPDQTFTTLPGGVYLFKPEADAFVEDAGVSAETRDHANFGFMSLILSARREAYLRFRVAGTEGPYLHGLLRLHGRQGGNSGGKLRLLPSAWEEDEVTWLTKPARFGTELGSIAGVTAGQWHEVRIDSAIAGNGVYNFALIGSGASTVSFDSRESTDAQPELIVFTNSGANATAVDTQHGTAAPLQFALSRHPNPFRASVRFEIALPSAGRISLKIYDVRGREVVTLLDDQGNAGRSFVNWNAHDALGNEVAAGVYFAVLRYENAAARTQRLVHLKPSKAMTR